MTPLEYIATNPSYEDSHSKWLVFDITNKRSMIAKQANIVTHHKIKPLGLTDGRWAVCCDIATEIGEKGVFRQLFAKLDKGKLSTAEIIEDAEFQLLKPVQPEIE